MMTYKPSKLGQTDLWFAIRVHQWVLSMQNYEFLRSAVTYDLCHPG